MAVQAVRNHQTVRLHLADPLNRQLQRAQMEGRLGEAAESPDQLFRIPFLRAVKKEPEKRRVTPERSQRGKPAQNALHVPGKRIQRKPVAENNVIKLLLSITAEP